MAISVNAASSQYLTCANAVVSGPPATLACWFNPSNTTDDHYLICVSDKDAATELIALVAVGAVLPDPIAAISRSVADGGRYAITTTSFSASAWCHACAVISANNARAAYINGGSKGTNASTVTLLGLDTTTVGRLTRPAPAGYASGAIAFPAIWNAALTDDEVAMLAAGVWPPLVRPQNLVAFWPLRGDSPEIDIIGRYEMTPYNGPTVTDNPRIFMPPRRQVSYSIPATVGFYRPFRTGLWTPGRL